MKLHLNEKKPANSIIKGRTKRTRNEPKWRGTLADWNKVKWNGMRWNDTHQLGTLLRWSQVTPIKPKMFPHSAMPFGRPRSVDLMSRSLNPSLDGLVLHGAGLGGASGGASGTASAGPGSAMWRSRSGLDRCLKRILLWFFTEKNETSTRFISFRFTYNVTGMAKKELSEFHNGDKLSFALHISCSIKWAILFAGDQLWTF